MPLKMGHLFSNLGRMTYASIHLALEHDFGACSKQLLWLMLAYCQSGFWKRWSSVKFYANIICSYTEKGSIIRIHTNNYTALNYIMPYPELVQFVCYICKAVIPAAQWGRDKVSVSTDGEKYLWEGTIGCETSKKALSVSYHISQHKILFLLKNWTIWTCLLHNRGLYHLGPNVLPNNIWSTRSLFSRALNNYPSAQDELPP